MILMIGNRLDYLKRLAEAFHLQDREASFAQTESELAKIDLEKVGVVFVDLFWLYESKNPANIDSAIKQLRKSGYAGIIEACANNPHSNICIANSLGNSSVWEIPEKKDYPDLSIEEIAKKLAPLIP
ncbi:MAG: hypothetical protein WC536_00965 [Patescibacteria group bacterium]